MANPHKGELDLAIGARTYRLAVDLNAICELEDLFSTPAKQVTFNDVVQGMMNSNMRYVRGFFWAALQKHHPEVGLRDVAGLIQDAGGLQQFMDLITRLLTFTQPDEEDAKALEARAKDRPPRKARAGNAAVGGTGKPSTSTPAKSA